jgi:shikimate dehydrogenase
MKIMNSRVTGKTKLFASIGDPVEHSLSPEIHNSIFDLNNLNNVHLPIKITTENLEKYIIVLRNNFTGLSVTKPHKQKIIPYLDELDEEAKWYGAVNAIKVENGKMIGYNTDGHGFVRALESEGIDITGKKVLLIGAGGAASVVANELLKLGADLTISNRTIKKAEELKERLATRWDSERIKICKVDDLQSGYYGIVNATSVGMYPEINGMPIKEDVLKGASFVFDLIYNPYHTQLLQKAQAYGCKCINGFSMLFYQAVKAQEIWTGLTHDKDALVSLMNEIENYFHNMNAKK